VTPQPRPWDRPAPRGENLNQNRWSVGPAMGHIARVELEDHGPGRFACQVKTAFGVPKGADTPALPC
jgi:hypothetical protein